MSSKHILCALLLGASLTACSEVDLCEQSHPHQAGLNFSYDWNGRTDVPDTMGVLVYKVVGQQKQIAAVRTSDNWLCIFEGTDIPDDLKQHTPATPDESTDGNESANALRRLSAAYADEADGDDTPVVDPSDPTEPTDSDNPEEPTDPDNPANPEEPTTPDDPSTNNPDERYEWKSVEHVQRGEYKFVTFPLGNDQLDYSELNHFLNSPAAESPLQNVGFTYKQYNVDDPNLNKPTLGWNDFNPYAKYIRPDVSTLYYDSTQIVSISSDQLTTQRFKPRTLSQDIDINFNIVKDTKNVKFTIDEVWAEISGVPNHIMLNTGYLDISKTSKIMFPVTITPSLADANGKDTNTNSRIRCQGNINVTGIVNVQRGYGESIEDVRKKIYGPGIMQVIIYSHVTEPGTGRVYPKKWQGIINLYHTLNKAKLITVTPDGRYVRKNGDHGTINISAEIILDGNTIGSDDSQGDALDRWISTDDIHVDI